MRIGERSPDAPLIAILGYKRIYLTNSNKAKGLYEMTDLMTQNQAQKIYFVRGCAVMLDRDLAELYEVETRILNQAVKRNIGRFPISFMFQLTKEELDNLRSQFVITDSNSFSISSKSRALPNAFSEHGVLMLAAILNSKVAIDVSVKLIEEFNRLRKASLTQDEILNRLDQHDQQFDMVFKAINRIYEIEQTQEKKKFGFIAKLEAKGSNEA